MQVGSVGSWANPRGVVELSMTRGSVRAISVLLGDPGAGAGAATGDAVREVVVPPRLVVRASTAPPPRGARSVDDR